MYFLNTMTKVVLVILNIIQITTQLCVDTTALTETDIYLQKCLLGITKLASVQDCAVSCMNLKDCMSFGFEPREHLCHFHSETKSTALEIDYKPSWYHGEISVWPQEFAGPCSSHVCSSGEICEINRVLNTPYCKLANLYLPPNTCAVPPNIPNADTSAGDQIVGSIRTYTCHAGYLHVSSDTTSITTTCLNAGVWSDVLFSCDGPYVRLEMENEPNYVFHPIDPATLHILVGTTSSLRLMVKGCSDANFLVHDGEDYTTSPNKYEIVIGGWANSQSAIAECIQCSFLDVHSEADIISCNEFRPLWISWKAGIVAAGKGLVVGEQTFLQIPTPAPFNINYVSYSAFANNHNIWLFMPQE